MTKGNGENCTENKDCQSYKCNEEKKCIDRNYTFTQSQGTSQTQTQQSQSQDIQDSQSQDENISQGNYFDIITRLFSKTADDLPHEKNLGYIIDEGSEIKELQPTKVDIDDGELQGSSVGEIGKRIREPISKHNKKARNTSVDSPDTPEMDSDI